MDFADGNMHWTDSKSWREKNKTKKKKTSLCVCQTAPDWKHYMQSLTHVAHAVPATHFLPTITDHFTSTIRQSNIWRTILIGYKTRLRCGDAGVTLQSSRENRWSRCKLVSAQILHTEKNVRMMQRGYFILFSLSTNAIRRPESTMNPSW